jgi:phosphoenolpyruvate carboxylase
MTASGSDRKARRRVVRNAARREEPRTVGTERARDPLSREVKLLGALLGQVIAEQGGPALLDLVERCRLRSIAFREIGDEAAENALAAELDSLDVAEAEALTKAFSLYLAARARLVERSRRRTAGPDADYAGSDRAPDGGATSNDVDGAAALLPAPGAA